MNGNSLEEAWQHACSEFFWFIGHSVALCYQAHTQHLWIQMFRISLSFSFSLLPIQFLTVLLLFCLLFLKWKCNVFSKTTCLDKNWFLFISIRLILIKLHDEFIMDYCSAAGNWEPSLVALGADRQEGRWLRASTLTLDTEAVCEATWEACQP